MPTVGECLKRSYIVEDEHLASRFGSGLVDVLSTPALVGFCEETARLSVDAALRPGEQTVGASIALQHLAPTPPGWEVTVRAELTEVNGRRLRFVVEASDEAELIARGEHVRVIVNGARFTRRVRDKPRGTSEVAGEGPT
jgi:predicted thioesterase